MRSWGLGSILSAGRRSRAAGGARASAPAGPVPLTGPVAGFTGSLPAGRAAPGTVTTNVDTSAAAGLSRR